MYNVRIYKDSGFNAVNIPDSPEVLSRTQYIDVDPIDIMQNEMLRSVTVRITHSDLQGADYCKIFNDSDTGIYANGMYYFVTAYEMLNMDTARLFLLFDGITSAGGILKLNFIDGVTVRHTVDDDTFGKYTEEDEYLNPASPLVIDNIGMVFKSDENADITIVESTIDLAKMSDGYNTAVEYGTVEGEGTHTSSSGASHSGGGTSFDSETETGTNTSDTETETSTSNTSTSSSTASQSGGTVIVPGTAPLSSERTKYAMETDDGGVVRKNSPNTMCYISELVTDGTNRVRDLSVESAIISQVKYNKAYVIPVVKTGTEARECDYIQGRNRTEDLTQLPFIWNSNVKNKRLLYGSNVPYAIVTVSGNSAFFDAEDIYNNGETCPKIKMIADPRPGGCPYFRFKTYLGDSSDEGFFVNCISGANWEQVPLTWTQASGGYLMRENLDAKLSVNELGITQSKIHAAASGTKSIMGTVKNFVEGDYFNAINEGINAATTAADLYIDIKKYDIEKQNELINYGVAMAAVAPSIQFPFNADLLRDFFGNGVFVYRMRYSDDDVNRIDKILTMYGYKHSQSLPDTNLHARQYFDYIQANGMSINKSDGFKLPKWWNDVISAQLGTGTRIWHILPSQWTYNDNPII